MIMILSRFIGLSLLLASAETVSLAPTCGSNHTKLLLVVDVLSNTNLTIVRLKNIVDYFLKKMEDDNAKTLEVMLVDPFQNHTLLNLTKVNSSQEIAFAVHRFMRSNASIERPLNYTDALISGNEYLRNVLRNGKIGQKKYGQYFKIFLLRSNDLTFQDLSLKDALKKISSMSDVEPIFLFDMYHHKLSAMYRNLYHRGYPDVNIGGPVVFIYDNDDFTNYNPVTIEVCGDCPKGWELYKNYWRSCYRVELLDQTISWTQASSRCDSLESTLPVIEEEEELTFLIKFLQKQFDTLHDKLETKFARATANIGLSYKYVPKKHHFEWLYARPFNLHSDLITRAPCVAITIPLNVRNKTEVIKWETFSCDDENSRILICEVHRKTFHNFTGLKESIEATVHNKINWTINQIMNKTRIEFSESIELMEFDCEDSVYKIPYTSVCDGAKDCLNGRDEQYCNTIKVTDTLNYFYCVNPNQVGGYRTRFSMNSKYRCDLIQDCPDNSDEIGCDGCMGKQCKDGTCLPGHWLSRDNDECPLFTVNNQTAFLNVSKRCQGQCSGFIQFSHEISYCDGNTNLEENSKWAPKCLYFKRKTKGISGCHNHNHLKACNEFHCPEGFFKCLYSYCIPVFYVYDGNFDCPYGEDETCVILSLLEPTLLKCIRPYIHIHQVHICDGVPQCPDGEDEKDCTTFCPLGFDCFRTAVVVSNYTLAPNIVSLNVFDVTTKFLNLSGIELSHLKEPYFLPNLLELHATHCKLVSLEFFFPTKSNNTYLFTANFSYNNLTVLNNELSSLMNLQFLSLSHNEHLSIIGIFSLQSPKLHSLDLSFTAISILELKIFENHRSLKMLNLYQTNIAKIGSLQSIKQLDYLNLQKTQLKKEDMTQILSSVKVSSSLYVDSYIFCCPEISKGGTPRHACHTPPETFSSCEDLLGDLFKRSLMWLVAGVSLIGNVIVLTYRLVYDRGVLKKGYGIFVANLSVSDFIMGVYLLIIATADVRYRDEYVLHESEWRHSSLCKTAGFLSTLSSETSTLFVFLITVDRGLVIRFPFGDHRFTKFGLIISVVLTWIIGIMLAFIPLMYPEWMLYSSNGMCLGLPLATGRQQLFIYSFGVFICFNFILFVCIALGQLFILRLIWLEHSIQMTDVQSVARRVQDINIAQQLFLVVLSNFLCWFPICVLGLRSLTGYEVSPDTYAWLVVFVMPLNAAVNPMIYTIPVVYRKWRGFKTRGYHQNLSLRNKSLTTETKF